MNYYELRKRAFQAIDQMDEDGKTQATMIYRISTEFGFNKKIVKERLAMREALRK